MSKIQVTRRNFVKSATGVILLMMAFPSVSNAIEPDADPPVATDDSAGTSAGTYVYKGQHLEPHQAACSYQTRTVNTPF